MITVELKPGYKLMMYLGCVLTAGMLAAGIWTLYKSLLTKEDVTQITAGTLLLVTLVLGLSIINALKKMHINKSTGAMRITLFGKTLEQYPSKQKLQWKETLQANQYTKTEAIKFTYANKPGHVFGVAHYQNFQEAKAYFKSHYVQNPGIKFNEYAVLLKPALAIIILTLLYTLMY